MTRRALPPAKIMMYLITSALHHHQLWIYTYDNTFLDREQKWARYLGSSQDDPQMESLQRRVPVGYWCSRTVGLPTLSVGTPALVRGIVLGAWFERGAPVVLRQFTERSLYVFGNARVGSRKATCLFLTCRGPRLWIFSNLCYKLGSGHQ